MKTETSLVKRLVLESKPEVINVIEDTIDEVCREMDVKDDVYGNIMVAVTEAVNNSVFHGNGQDPSKKVYVDVEKESTYRLLVRVTDEGPGFDHAGLPDPTSPENLEEIGGRGVFLMTHLCDELSFLNDGKCVEMVFNI